MEILKGFITIQSRICRLKPLGYWTAGLVVCALCGPSAHAAQGGLSNELRCIRALTTPSQKGPLHYWKGTGATLPGVNSKQQGLYLFTESEAYFFLTPHDQKPPAGFSDKAGYHFRGKVSLNGIFSRSSELYLAVQGKNVKLMNPSEAKATLPKNDTGKLNQYYPAVKVVEFLNNEARDELHSAMLPLISGSNADWLKAKNDGLPVSDVAHLDALVFCRGIPDPKVQSAVETEITQFKDQMRTPFGIPTGGNPNSPAPIQRTAQ